MPRSAIRIVSKLTTTVDPAWARWMRELRALRGGIYVKAGYLGDDAVAENGDMTMPRLAAIHEYGYPEGHIPARPHVGPAFDANRQKYEELLVKVLRAWMDGKLSIKEGLGLLGLQMVADIRAHVTEGPGVPPPNVPSVYRRKVAQAYKNLRRRRRKKQGPIMGPRTLVDTGRMLGSLAHAVLTGKNQRPQREG